MRPLRPVLAVSLLVAVALARPAGAATSLGLGADYLLDPEIGELQLTLVADTRLARRVTLGARFGMLYLPEPNQLGVPLDLRLRIRGARVYAEGLLGPWIVFDDDVRLHAGFGFGVLTRSLSFGLEVGWLDPTAMIGVRVGLPL